MSDNTLNRSRNLGKIVLPTDILEDFYMENIAGRPPYIDLQVLRPRDLLYLRFSLINFKYVSGGENQPGTIKRGSSEDESYIIVQFPRQSIMEEAFFEEDPNFNDPKKALEPTDQTPPIRARISNPSWLVFLYPSNAEPILFTIDGLLTAIRDLPLIVAPTALPPLDLNNWKPEDQKLAALDDQTSYRYKNRVLQEQMRHIREAFGELAGQEKPLDPPPKLVEPTWNETRIEAPFRLILSPNRYAAWVHSLNEVKVRFGDIDWVELWHTRLATRMQSGEIVEGKSPLRTVRAIWARDAKFKDETSDPPKIYNSTDQDKPPDDPYRGALDAFDRFNIVHLSANYNITTNVTKFTVSYDKNNNPINIPYIYSSEPYEPQPIEVDNLMLSSLGAWLNLRGSWSTLPDNLSVEEWRHISTMARDHYVRVVYKGYLFPFGHRASLIKVTERKFHGHLPGNPAYLRQRMFIVVREPERIYMPTGLEDENRQKYDLAFPFTRVRITTLVTPQLVNPEECGINGQGRLLFRPKITSSSDFRFNIIAEDLEGQSVEFSTPLNFIGKEIIDDDNWNSLISKAQNDFIGASTAASPAELFGQTVCFAESQEIDNTSLSAKLLYFGANVPDQQDQRKKLEEIYGSDVAPFYPRIEKAKVRIPAIQHLAKNDDVVVFKFPKEYLINGFKPSNIGQVFAEVIDDNDDHPVKLKFSNQSQRSGGFLSPDIQINGLSRLIGPVGGNLGNLGDSIGGKFDPKYFFQDELSQLKPKLFGVLNLWDIVNVVESFSDGDLVKVPRIITLAPKEAQGKLVDGQSDQRVSYDWTPSLKSWYKAGLLIFDAREGNDGKAEAILHLHIEADVRATNNGATTYKVSCGIENFNLNLIGKDTAASIVILHFKKIEFVYSGDNKADVNVDLEKIEFVGFLSFVDALKNLIPLDGFNDPPNLDISEKGITAGYTLALPNLSFGIFSLSNLSLSAGFSIPFSGDPLSVRFAFCSRENPFTLSVAIFSGGGFFAITLVPDGLQMLEASFEFGASISIDFGVASGGVHVMAGIYFKLEIITENEVDKNRGTFTGYFRMGGNVSVLGLISVSIELYLSLTYQDPGKVVGRAELTIEVSIFFFSISAKITVERKFAGSTSDPTFAQLMEPYPDPVKREQMIDPWVLYCEAFA